MAAASRQQSRRRSIGLPAPGYTVVLLCAGLAIMMGVSEAKGFLFSSAVLAVGFEALVTMMVIRALLRGYGFAPQFVDQIFEFNDRLSEKYQEKLIY